MRTMFRALPLLLAAAPLSATAQSIQAYWQPALKDASFTARVVMGDQRELAKINKDFGQSYRFKRMSVRMKEPFKLRLESTVDDTAMFFVVNGARRLIRIPRSNINIRENLATSPGKRQTALDFGMLTPGLFDGLFEAKFVRMDRATGDPVFDLTYEKRLNDTSRHRVWIDKTKKYIKRREWYSQLDGRLLATFTYENPEQQGGVWFPSRVIVRNAENRQAGVTQYEGLKINTGLPDSLFKVD